MAERGKELILDYSKIVAVSGSNFKPVHMPPPPLPRPIQFACTQPPLPRPIRFMTPVSEAQILQAQEICTPATTNKSTNWSINLWKEWAENRKVCSHEHPDRLPHLMQIDDLIKWMCQFILDVRCKDSNEYPPNTIYQICCGILRHIKKYKPTINFFTQPEMEPIKKPWMVK